MTGGGTSPEALALFEEALERAPEDRAAFLAERTGQRAALRAEVEELLRLEGEGPAMPRVEVTPTFVDALEDAVPELPAGTRVGSFRIERSIGQGGMGRIYVAEQESPRRSVALKVLARGMDAEGARRRFQVEGELLAHLDHPGIAQVFETGVACVHVEERDAELPYIALELFEEAQSITEYARAAALPVDARVRLLVDVARAVHHAHQRSVIHRDLKPGNLLVDAAGRVHVIDFGIAWTDLDLGTSVHTRVGQLLGTPAYMSPEQFELPGPQLDIRVDVYAIGAVAYELLCGRPPFDASAHSLASLLQEISYTGPKRPRAVAPGLPRDLEAIVLRAMAPRREERYDSAAALADDLERYLRHETIEARRPTVAHQLRLFARRNRLFTAAVFVAGVGLVVSAGVSAWFGLEARSAARLERAQRERADRFLGRIFDDNLELVFDYADRAGSIRGGNELRLAMLRSAGERLQELEARAGEDPALLARIASAYVRLGEALGALDAPNAGDLEGATAYYARAEALLARTGEVAPELTRARMDIDQARGDELRASGDFDGALARYREAIQLGEQALVAHPEDEALRRVLLGRRRDLGTTLGSLRDHAGALEQFEAVVAGWDELLALHPDDVSLRLSRANATSSVAAATIGAKSPAEAVPLFEETLALYEGVLEEHPDDRQALSALVGVRYPFSDALVNAQEYQRAVEVTRAGIELAESLLESDPGDVQLQRWTGLLAFNTGWALSERAKRVRESGEDPKADLEAAREAFEHSLSVFEGLRDGGKLMPVEQGYIQAIQDRIHTVEIELGSE